MGRDKLVEDKQLYVEYRAHLVYEIINTSFSSMITLEQYEPDKLIVMSLMRNFYLLFALCPWLHYSRICIKMLLSCEDQPSTRREVNVSGNLQSHHPQESQLRKWRTAFDSSKIFKSDDLWVSI